MALEQRLEQSQRLILTQTMLQSLELLQFSSTELQAYLQEAALSNPMLSVEDAPAPDTGSVELLREREYTAFSQASTAGEDERPDFTAFYARPRSFTDHLKEQLGQMKLLDEETLARCLYLVDSLSSSGYLDCPLEELAQETGQSLFDMEQALFVVQSLDPIGVGARSLSECLLLQLAQGRDFTERNIHLICSGLPLIAKRDLRGLASLLHAPAEEIERSIETIRALNPIPSQGFLTEQGCGYVRPEAVIRCEEGRVVVEMNDRLLPRVQLDPTYCSMLTSEDGEAREYLTKKQAEAKALLANLDNRAHTIARVLCAVAQVQEAYFLHGGDLAPLTMQQLADTLGLNVSTVSRAVKGKYVQFGTSVFPIRELLTAPLQAAAGAVSVEAVKQRIRRFIAAEDPQKPLSDETIAQALDQAGIQISRRTVAKYRAEMDIPTAAGRKWGRR